MRIAGIIAEYDPFHKGHAYHIAKTREETGCDYVIVCMDGPFTQRGAPALFSKWDRAQMALACGADAVFELPTLMAVRTADVFAGSGVAILGSLGCDVLSFGCETEDRTLIEALASLKIREPEAFRARLEALLAQGMSHAAAYGRAAAEYLSVDPELLNRPNLILAAEYTRAIRAGSYRMEPHAVKRVGDYHDEALPAAADPDVSADSDPRPSQPCAAAGLASASAIRAAWLRGEYDRALSRIPEAARPFLSRETRHSLDDILLYRLRAMTREEWLALPGMAEGLENLLMKQCRICPDADTLIDAVKSRRYTRARIQRLLTHALLGMDQALIDANPKPAYARLIGMRSDASPLLRELKRRSTLPIVSDPARLKDDAIFEFECRASDLWALGNKNPAQRAAGREYTEKFIRMECSY